MDFCIWDNQRIAAYKRKLQLLQADAVIYVKRAVESATRLKNWVVVRGPEHFICHTKFKAMDLLGDWIAYNPKGLSYFYDLTSCDLL